MRGQLSFSLGNRSPSEESIAAMRLLTFFLAAKRISSLPLCSGVLTGGAASSEDAEVAEEVEALRLLLVEAMVFQGGKGWWLE